MLVDTFSPLQQGCCMRKKLTNLNAECVNAVDDLLHAKMAPQKMMGGGGGGGGGGNTAEGTTCPFDVLCG